MLEALRSEVQVRHSRLLAAASPDLDQLHFFTWVPEAQTLMEWAYPARQGIEKASPDLKTSCIVYPGHGLGGLDEQRLHKYLDKVRFCSIEELANRLQNPQEPKRRATRNRARRELTHGGVVGRATRTGMSSSRSVTGPNHLDDVVYRLATAILTSSARLGVRRRPAHLEELPRLDV